MLNLIKRLTVSLKDSLDIQNKYEELTMQLIQENQFLIDTISKNNLGKITSERRSLLLQIEKFEISANAIKNEANIIKNEYSDKLNKITFLLKDVESKQSEIDKYIVSEAKKRVSKKEKNLDSQYIEKCNELKLKYKEKENILNQKIRNIKQILFVSMLCMITAIISSLLGIQLLLILIPIIIITSFVLIKKSNERS